MLFACGPSSEYRSAAKAGCGLTVAPVGCTLCYFLQKVRLLGRAVPVEPVERLEQVDRVRLV